MRNNSVYGCLGPVTSSVGVFFGREQDWFLRDHTERNSRIVRLSKFVDVLGGNGACLNRHLVEFLEITGIHSCLVGALVHLPLGYNFRTINQGDY